MKCIFSTSGGMARECTTFYKRVASMLADKHQEHYLQVLGWLRCRINFALLRAAIMPIRGNQSPFQSTVHDVPLATCELGASSKDLTHLTSNTDCAWANSLAKWLLFIVLTFLYCMYEYYWSMFTSLWMNVHFFVYENWLTWYGRVFWYNCNDARRPI